MKPDWVIAAERAKALRREKARFDAERLKEKNFIEVSQMRLIHEFLKLRKASGINSRSKVDDPMIRRTETS